MSCEQAASNNCKIKQERAFSRKQKARNSSELGMQIVWFRERLCNQAEVKACHHALKPFQLIKLICYDPKNSFHE